MSKSATKASRSEMDEFKRLVFRQEHHSLRALDDRVSEIEEVEHFGDMLPDALQKSQENHSDDLAKALELPLVEAMKRSVEKDKEPISSALFPILGPAIRLYVTELFRNMTEQLNETIKSATSAKQIKWRIRAKMAGKTYAEYVLLKTSRYRIERVFVIAANSGLLLRHCAREENVHDEPELVSGMLVAIRSFAKDSFSGGRDDSGELKRFSFGEKEIFIEVSPHAIIAAVGEGTPPASFHEALSTTVEEIHQRDGRLISNWNGGMEAFDHLEPELEELLVESRGSGEPDDGVSNPWPMRIFLILIGLGLGTWIAFSVLHHSKWKKGIEALRAQPGIEVLRAEKSGWNRMSIHLLKDPLAVSPLVVLKDAGADSERASLEISPFLSLEEPIASERRREKIASEAENQRAIDDLTRRIEKLDQKLTLTRIRELKNRIESMALTYVSGTTSMVDSEKEQRQLLYRRLKLLDEYCSLTEQPLYGIQVYGLPLRGAYSEGNREIVTRRLAIDNAGLIDAGFDASRIQSFRTISSKEGRRGLYLVLVSPKPVPQE